MDLLRFILCAVGLILLLPWIRFVFRRIVMAAKIRRTARANGWTFTPARPLWLFAPNGGTAPDCRIEGECAGRPRVYAVKLWASVRKMQNVYFIGSDPQSVRCRRIIPLAGRFASRFDWNMGELTDGTGGGVNLIRESREKPRAAVDYYTDAAGRFRPETVPVLLFCPAPLNVAEGRVVPLTHTTVERLPMFSKPAETTVTVRRLFDGELLHEREYVFGTEAFCSELRHPHIGF